MIMSPPKTPASFDRFPTPRSVSSEQQAGSQGSPHANVASPHTRSRFSTPSPQLESAWSDSDLSGGASERGPARMAVPQSVRNTHQWLQSALNRPATPQTQPFSLTGLGLSNVPRLDEARHAGSPQRAPVGLGLLGSAFTFGERPSPILEQAPAPVPVNAERIRRRELANRPADFAPVMLHSPTALLRAFEASFVLSHEYIAPGPSGSSSAFPQQANSSPHTATSISEMDLGSPEQKLHTPPEAPSSGRFKRARFS